MVIHTIPAWASILVVISSFSVSYAQAPDASVLIKEIGRASNDSLLWGPYRPNLYFGVRPRIPKSLMTGLLWAKPDNFQSVQTDFRHTCEQNDGMAGYGWDEYDVRKGGRQTIHDAGNLIDIQTEFAKVPGGAHGGSWGVRIRGVPREGAPRDLKTTLVFTASMEGLGSLEVENERDTLGYEEAVILKGKTVELGNFKLEVTEGPTSNRHPTHTHPSHAEKPLDRTIVYSSTVPDEALWQAKAVIFTQMKHEVDGYMAKYGEENVPPPWQVFTVSNDPGVGNLHLIQKVFEGEFEFDILYSSGSASKALTSEILTDHIESAVDSFSARFTRLFKPVSPFTSPKYTKFSKELFSNLIGGIGYFAGDAVVDRSYASEYDEDSEGFWIEAAEARARNKPELEGPSQLFTSIPSRPFFPRGFLWDEGFHLIPVADWDLDLTIEIVKSWFSLMDADGWIAREQILGPEARSKVPAEFQTQYPHYANPPTLFLILDIFIDKLQLSNDTIISADSTASSQDDPLLYTASATNPTVAIQYLRDLYPLLKRQFSWFRTTQNGEVRAYDRTAYSSREAYRWRGRTPQHILTSGLDDYPRAQPPHPGELHVDLISWMGMMTRVMKRIATTIDETDDVAEYTTIERAILRNIEDLHWSEKDQTYCDASIDDYEEHALVCHKGYISLFPFMTGLMDKESKRLKAVLDLIHDPEELWSDYGIRSLSKKDAFYGTDENYWRSPIWVNMNYLILSNLLTIAQAPLPNPHKSQAREMYIGLRKNLVQNVFTQWENTGFAWEQYNPETGAGQRTQHFTGWTSLVVKIMRMVDLESVNETHDEL